MPESAERRRRPVSGLFNRLLYDTVPPEAGKPAPPAAQGPSFARPRETIHDLLAGVSRRTLAAVIHALELRRLRFAAGSRTIDAVLAEIRPMLRGLDLPRLPTLSRLVWAPLQPLLVDGLDRVGDAAVRPWVLSRAWLGPLWRFMVERNGRRLGTLSGRLEAIMATVDPRTPGDVDTALRSEAVANITLDAQGEALRCLNALAGDAGEARLFADRLARTGDLPPDLWDPERIADAAGRLAALMAVSVELRDPFLSLVMGIDGRLASPGWRDDREFLYDLHKDVERTLQGFAAAGPAAQERAAAFLVMVARSVEAPWPLVAALRLSTQQRPGGAGQIDDAGAPPAVLALMEHLVGEAERLGTAAVDALQFEPADAPPADVFDAHARTMAAGHWVHGLLGAGVLEATGLRHKRVLSVRATLMPLTANRLLPTLRLLVLAPFTERRVSAALAGSGPEERFAAAERAASLLHRTMDGPDGLRCHSQATQILGEVESALNRVFEKRLPELAPGDEAAAVAMNALIRVTDAVRPGLGSSFARRVLNRMRPAPGGGGADRTGDGGRP